MKSKRPAGKGSNGKTRGGLNDLLYYEPLQSELTIDDLPLDKYFRRTEVATMRSGWADREAKFVGIKCGRNGIAHAHQDLGSFILYLIIRGRCIAGGNVDLSALQNQRQAVIIVTAAEEQQAKQNAEVAA